MTENTTATVPSRVGVLGGGRMGAGIAHAFLISGARVTVVEVDGPAAESAKERVESDLAKSLERGKIDGNLDTWTQNFAVSVDYADFADCELVIEAVPEIWDLKVSSLQRVEENLSETAWLATNTSSLSVDGLADELQRPERFCGPVRSGRLLRFPTGTRNSRCSTGSSAAGHPRGPKDRLQHPSRARRTRHVGGRRSPEPTADTRVGREGREAGHRACRAHERP